MSLSSRAAEVLRLRQFLVRERYPRLQMSLLVAITGGVGFVASVLLFHAGMLSMAWRYFLACGLAYGAFLLLLWAWLREGIDDPSGIIDPSLAPDVSLDAVDLLRFGRRAAGEVAGQFGGSGASGAFDASETLATDVDGSLLGDALGSVAEGEELALPLLALAFFVALLFSSGWLVYSAPELFAELLLDASLATGLYRKLRHLERRHWLETAFRQTVLPFFLTAAVLAGVGWGLAQYAPGAHTMGEVLRYTPPAEH